MHPKTESSSAVCITPRSQVIKISQKALRCASHCRVKLCSVLLTVESSSSIHPTTESGSSVCITPRSQVIKISQKAPRCASHCRVKLCSVLLTMESSSAVYIPPRSQGPQYASNSGVKLHTAESKFKSL